jgi:hypothetical protein
VDAIFDFLYSKTGICRGYGLGGGASLLFILRMGLSFIQVGRWKAPVCPRGNHRLQYVMKSFDNQGKNAGKKFRRFFWHPFCDKAIVSGNMEAIQWIFPEK